MKKFLGTVIVALVALVTLAPSHNAEAQVYGSYCCDLGIYNEPRVRCAIWPAAPVGAGCICPGIYGEGFVCH